MGIILYSPQRKQFQFMQKRHIYFFIGTTAELIKIAPIIKEFKKRRINFKIITSGQTKVLFEDLTDYTGPIKADISFKERVNKSSIFYFIFWAARTFLLALLTLHKEFKGLNKNNSYFIVYGDPVSTSIGALVALIYGLKLVHIESGDMTFNVLEPFPEEICRHINVHSADILFPPNQWAKNNLKDINKVKINTQYNTLIETFWWAMKALKTKLSIKNIKKFKKYYILILHRQEHVLFRKNWSKSILEFVIKNADQNLNCLLFDHPLTIKIIESLKLNSNIQRRIKIISPVPYPDFLSLMENAQFIASDGCTNQLEAYLMGKPCLVLRDRTEQIEGVGKNVVICKSDKKIIRNFLDDYKKCRTKPISVKIRPSKIIADYLMSI